MNLVSKPIRLIREKGFINFTRVILFRTLITPSLGLLKLFAPHLYTKLTRVLYGINKKLDRLTELHAAKINSLSEGKKKKLFIDCGVNEGFVLRRYIEALPNFHFIGFEIQSELIDIAQFTNPSAYIFNKAVSDKYEFLTMFLPKSYGPNFRGGTSVEPNKIKSDELHSKRTIEAINFVDFLKNKDVNNDYDFVAVKMDIEGSEYRIIDALYQAFSKDKLRLIDYLFIEFHPQVLVKSETQLDYENKLNDMKIVVSK